MGEWHAAPARRWVDRSWVVLWARSPMVRHYCDPGPAGDHVRWLTSVKRPESLRRWAWGEERIAGGRWTGVRVTATPRMGFVAVGPVSELVGWLLAVYATWRALRASPGPGAG